jgi:hypothetical protein
MKMHTQKSGRRRLDSMLLAALAVSCSPVSAQQKTIDCAAAHDIASLAYTEIRTSLSQGDYRSAYRLKDVFWGVEKYGGSCKTVRIMADRLAQNRLGRNDVFVDNRDGDRGPSSGGSADYGTASGSSGATGSSGYGAGGTRAETSATFGPPIGSDSSKLPGKPGSSAAKDSSASSGRSGTSGKSATSRHTTKSGGSGKSRQPSDRH